MLVTFLLIYVLRALFFSEIVFLVEEIKKIKFYSLNSVADYCDMQKRIDPVDGAGGGGHHAANEENTAHFLVWSACSGNRQEVDMQKRIDPVDGAGGGGHHAANEKIPLIPGMVSLFRQQAG